MNKLEAISPIDGRYSKATKPLAKYFSEKALMKYRLNVEGEYLISLSEHPLIKTRDFSKQEKKLIRKLHKISNKDAELIKTIETENHGIKEINKGYKTNHDVKAIEYYMKHKLKETSLKDSLEWIHFALTSEDINNLAYGLMLSDGIENVIFPEAVEVYGRLEELARQYRIVPMLARSHGQPASPTTTGKEFKVFASRLERQFDQLASYEILAKLNGATGNYNAHHIAYPDVNWPDFTKSFIEKLSQKRMIKLKPNLITTQTEPHDTYAELFDNLKRLNNIIIDFNQDIWRYISDDWIKQKSGEEVGSSTMPHKVNPIDFENSEGNLGIANALLKYFSSKLPISRLQRDLSDSTVERNFGVALGHSLIGYKSTLRGLNKIMVDGEKVIKEIKKHPEIISEAIQTILRREGIQTPYEQLKELTRGKKITMKEMETFIEKLQISDKLKTELKQIKPENYTGIAGILATVEDPR
ncbi:MAG: adenylosuccinate lyase [Nanoarchaeota archaeon]|nr:adenylosuccinate lyase [Nanoarchaeota archaeon]